MRHRAWAVPLLPPLLLWLVLLAPPVRRQVEASMTAQMLVQIPLLVFVGCLLARALPARVEAATARWNRGGITGLALASVVAAYWMLPRSLDASVTSPLLAAAKYLSVPLLIGLPFTATWPRMGFVVRGVFLAEFIATGFRLGWLYLISPVRLCSNYGLDDQRRLGLSMLALGGGLLAWVAGKLLWGDFETFPFTQATAEAHLLDSRRAEQRLYLEEERHGIGQWLPPQ